MIKKGDIVRVNSKKNPTWNMNGRVGKVRHIIKDAFSAYVEFMGMSLWVDTSLLEKMKEPEKIRKDGKTGIEILDGVI